MNQDKEMPLYRCHKVVRAAKITKVVMTDDRNYADPKTADLELGEIDGLWVTTPRWCQEHKVEVGGYLVEYEDGYRSYSPAKAFEEGYSLEETDSNLLSHARTELAAIGMIKDGPSEGPNKWMGEHILELLTVFSRQGHSGASAPYCVANFSALARWEPLCPLTGKDDEWNEVGEGLFQNRRCSHVFKENGRVYDGEGRIFREKNGTCFTGAGSRVDITFPYFPKHEYVDVCEHGREMTDYCDPCGRINGA